MPLKLTTVTQVGTYFKIPALIEAFATLKEGDLVQITLMFARANTLSNKESPLVTFTNLQTKQQHTTSWFLSRKLANRLKLTEYKEKKDVKETS